MQRTREAIKESCLKLLEEKPLSQITVKAIVEDCGINRNSFYYHFPDIPALVEEICRDNAERLIAEYGDAASLQDCLSAATAFARENRRVVQHIYRSVRRDLFEQYLYRVCHDVIIAYFDKAYGTLPVSDGDREIMVRFYQCEMVGQILLWLESDMKYDVQAQYTRLLELREGFLDEMVRRCTAPRPEGGTEPDRTDT